MSIRMSYRDFFDRCLLIKYSGDSSLTEFGAPMDCYGLVYWFYKLCLGIELERTRVKRFEDIKFIKYTEVDTPKNGDIVYMIPRINNGAPHIGVCLDDIVYHFTYEGLRAQSRFKIIDSIRGYYHVDACQNP